MKRILFLLFAMMSISTCIIAQNYNNIVNYNSSSYPVNGVKIKTNIPYENMYTLPLIKIEGVDYGKQRILNLQLTFYVYDDIFYFSSVSSNGNSTPNVWLSNESGKISIFIGETVYFQRFTVSAFAQGQDEKLSDFQNWTVVDEPLSGSNQTKVDYRNIFSGKVGIGVEYPENELDVNGTVRAKEIKVSSDWADFVFKKDYQLPTLEEVKAHIDEKGTLPGVPSESEVKANGISLGESNALLLQKIEELTLYVIKQQEEINELKSQNKK